MKSSYQIFLFLQIAFVVLAGLPICNKYSDQLGNNNCSKIKSDEESIEFFLKKCPNNKYCYYYLEETDEKCHDKPFKRLPGEYCNENDDCESNDCLKKNKVCKVKNENCTTSKDCSPGYYCNHASNASGNSTCVELKKITETCGLTDPCHLNLVCDNNTCKEIGSLKNGSPAMAPAACKSFYLVNGLCQNFPILTNTTLECTKENYICEYINATTKNKTKTNCSCGINREGISYCIPEVGRRVNDRDVRRSNKDVFIYNIIVHKLCEKSR